ncbi:MAG: hypothetical protein CM15mP77_3120 [Synechococcus sp.]|nr:MAG: hypothetical protein CM15mP77_3120 [Synechococcus sp.]
MVLLTASWATTRAVSSGFRPFGDLLPAGHGAGPDVLNRLAFRHLNRFRSTFPGVQQVGPTVSDFGFEFALPESMADFHEAIDLGERHP